MTYSDDMIRTWEEQVDRADAVRQMAQSKGWRIMCEHSTQLYEKKILDSFRRISGETNYDAGFRILQGEYQMLNHLLRVPQEIIEIGDQAKRNLDRARNTAN
ncbi:MAG: hypothetical protein C4541_09090 [Candidatus Auribacter fodinae]|jgi:hypothetical protein|uniref:Uncharacterized protein n=1 Tax=Candidatus Auribacter fodinae TaxID=2093366 RepID=A0A3A4QVU2_9BACT|nr:MAG: hypothetical protein C4541_09090 [Candidatus Auribacter fodinae]